MDKLAKLISLAVAINIRAPYVVNITAQSGCGVDVLVLRRIESDKVDFKIVDRFIAVDRDHALLSAALKAVEALADGTYVGGGEADASSTAV